ncbi:MAG TPA: hypothetical protein VLH84_00875 [Patescibacteria group bacterium]|nr:hypothetical protein [Patescibacteria group bacterium]
MANISTKPLTETPVPGSVDDEYFYRMLSPYALKLSEPYNSEENVILERCLEAYPDIADMNFVAVGGGELWELRRAARYAKQYTCIEPLADIFINDSVRYLIEQCSNVSFVPKRFGEVEREDLPQGKSFFMFLFNILAYVEDPVGAINHILQPGDVLFITTWANTPLAKQVRSVYFSYLNETEKEVVIDPEQSIGLTHLDHFPVEELKHFKRSERIKGTITDVLIIYT